MQLTNDKGSAIGLAVGAAILKILLKVLVYLFDKIFHPNKVDFPQKIVDPKWSVNAYFVMTSQFAKKKLFLFLTFLITCLTNSQ